MEFAIELKLLISLLIGAAIGLEREIHEKHDEEQSEKNEFSNIAFIGVRTLSLTTAFGAMAGIVYGNYHSIFLAIIIFFGLLLLAHYALTVTLTKDPGVTTELATAFCFLIGIAIGVELLPLQLILGISVVLMLILSSKNTVKNLVGGIRRHELQALITYGIIALVVLPSLPDKALTVENLPYARDIVSSLGLSFARWSHLEIINPFSMWKIVAIFTGVEFLGYILERSIGAGRGQILSSLVGGFVSSTATTQSLAAQSKKSHSANRLVGAALLATLASFFSLILIVLPINTIFVLRIFPTLAILILGFSIASYMFFRMEAEKKQKTTIQQKQSTTVFSLKPALIFASMFIVIKLVSKIALELFGQNGFLITSALAAFTGIDAVVINIAQLVTNTINMRLAVLAFILVNAVNLLAKTIYIYLQGSREMAWKYGVSVALIVASSFAGLLMI